MSHLRHGFQQDISIHALLAESDMDAYDVKVIVFDISIHALLAESDPAAQRGDRQAEHFYPRSPCGERPYPAPCPRHVSSNFYPRSPCGERPIYAKQAAIISSISIHALLAESDFCVVLCVFVFFFISIHALLAESDSKMLQKIGSFCSQTCYTTITIRDF